MLIHTSNPEKFRGKSGNGCLACCSSSPGDFIIIIIFSARNQSFSLFLVPMDDSKLNDAVSDKEADSFHDAPDEFPFYQSSSPQTHPDSPSLNGPRLRRRSFSHRFRNEPATTQSGNDSVPKSSLSFNYAVKDRNRKGLHNVKLLLDDEKSDRDSDRISSTSVCNDSFNSDVNKEGFPGKEAEKLGIENDYLKEFDCDQNSLVGFDYSGSEWRNKGLSGNLVEELGDGNDYSKESDRNSVNTDSSANTVVGFDYSGSNERKRRFLKKVEELGDGNDYVKESDSSRVSKEIQDSSASASSLVSFDYTGAEERKKKFIGKLDELEARRGKSELKEGEGINEEKRDNLAENSVNDDRVEANEPSLGFLFGLAGLVIKALVLQISFLVSCVTFPVRFVYNMYMFVVDPFRIKRRTAEFARSSMIKIIGFVSKKFLSFAGDWLKEHQSIWQLALRFGWGFLWASYVCTVLVTLLISAFLLSGVVMRKLVNEPIHIKETLTLDYTKYSPVAFVPVISCPNEPHDLSFAGKIDLGHTGSPRVIPRNHKFQVTISLMLPESDYNRNLGIFQVRVDLLSANGRTLATARRPCMLHFKSQPIRMLLTFFKIAPLVTGYSSESQTLTVNLKGFIEGEIPTSCLRVMIEQRAEFRPGAGIPEIYDASLTLESYLPLLKRLMWLWKKTLFVWLGLSFFIMQILCALVCCRPLILPRGRLGDRGAGNIVRQNNGSVQR